MTMLEKMKIASKIAAECLDAVEEILVPGINTDMINDFCHKFITENDAIPGTLNYKNFPKSVCVSVNEEICHGIPSKYKYIKDGDIVKVDIVVNKDGYFGDTCRSFTIGNVSPELERLSRACYEAMWAGIRTIRNGSCTGIIGKKIGDYAKKFGFSSVEVFCGHGIGKQLHMSPYVLNYDTQEPGKILRTGMFITVEPMFNIGSKNVKIGDDKWTAVTEDSSISSHWEHTIAVLNNGYEVLSLSKKEKNELL